MIDEYKDPSNPRKWVRVAVALRDQIKSGELKPLARLPSSRDLQSQHGVSERTVAHAHRELAQQGLIFRVPGLGYFVSS